MCGFAGQFQHSEQSAEEHAVSERMGALIHSRGPDDARSLQEGCFSTAFRRLSIIDLELGTQPFTTPDGRFCGVFNGEIYNYLILQKELAESGEEFSTNSEIEVMMKLFAREGASFVSRLRGMFALAFYDRDAETLMLARDYFGIKPLYYRLNEKGLCFASEAKAFFADESFPGFSVNPEKLQHYFTFQYIPGAESLTPGILQVPAGTYLTCKKGASPVITRYFDPMLKPDKSVSYEKKKERLREAVTESVKSHLLADVPVGTFLSSGIDSAIITSLASRFSPGIRAYTVAFGEKEYSEATEASAIAKHLDVEHITRIADAEDFKNAFERVVCHLDFPVADPSTVAIDLICERASQDLKVVLSGEGSDELFGGYKVYDESRFSSRIYRLPAFLKRFLLFLSERMPEGAKGKSFLYRGVTPLSERYVGNAFIFRDEEKSAFLKTFDANVHFSQETREIFERAEALSPMGKMQYVDLCTWLRGDILVKSDRLAMAHSLEIRVPFLDKEVFEAARGLCDADKLSHHTTKYILRDAFRDLIDGETFMRPKKGYPVPVRKWLRSGELYEWAREIFEHSEADAFVDKEYCLKLLEEHRAGTADHYRKLWTLLVFLTWYRLYVTGAEDTRARLADGRL